MNNNDVEIRFVKKWIDEDIIKLYKTGGWWKDEYDESGISKILEGSFAFAVVVNKYNNETIGMGRILSDGVSDAYIQDLIILPEYREKGIGKKLVESLIDYCHKNKIFWIALIAEPNQDEFYKKIGFKQMKNYIPLKYGGEKDVKY
jgi:ribosomal protein S18 acetylase RimI-like enzyme